jgi:hypothetical protein
MPVIKFDLDQHIYEKLVAVAIREWRPTHWQAEWLLRKAIIAESSAAGETTPRASQELRDDEVCVE